MDTLVTQVRKRQVDLLLPIQVLLLTIQVHNHQEDLPLVIQALPLAIQVHKQQDDLLLATQVLLVATQVHKVIRVQLLVIQAHKRPVIQDLLRVIRVQAVILAHKHHLALVFQVPHHLLHFLDLAEVFLQGVVPQAGLAIKVGLPPRHLQALQELTLHLKVDWDKDKDLPTLV